MKILHLTDTHVKAQPDPIVNSNARLLNAIYSVNQHHSDADCCVITGDLVDDGRIESYRVLRELLSELTVPVKLLLGNHDNRANFLTVFPEQARDENDFIQYGWEDADWSFIVLDTLEDGNIYGWMCEKRLAFLEAKLRSAANKDVYIFMHHSVISLGLRHHDNIGLVQADRFLEICAKHGRVRHIFAGHVHAEISASVNNIYVRTSRGISQHLLFDTKNVNATYVKHTPAYNIILMDDRSTTIHLYDLMHQSEIIGGSKLAPHQEWQGN